MGAKMQNTKQRILDEALMLFSTRGYELVTVAEIADAVGIKAPSLYKHYKSKQEIYEAIIVEMDSRYNDYMSSMLMDGKDAQKDGDFYASVDEEGLVKFGLALFKHYLHDEYASKFRRMLTLAQYADRNLSDVFVRRYFDEPLKYLEKTFAMLSGAGRLAPEDPQVLALHYYAPIFLLLSLCDRHPEMEQDAIKMKERHIRQFIRAYGNGSNPEQPD